jgi:NADH:ubiquinone oxidoreductase subunit K
MILILELLSIIRLFAARFYIKLSTSLNLIFILIRIIVGEATLGLAVLVSLVRSNSNSLIMRRMN